MNTSFTKYTPKKAQKRRQENLLEDIQLGRVDQPAQVVTFGFPSDANKTTTSVHLLIKDVESIKTIQKLQTDLELKSNGDTLNSSIIRTIDVDGVSYPVIRCKFTKDERNFSSADEQGVSSLHSLCFGSGVVGIFRPSVWHRQGECGITFYGNNIHFCGMCDDPVGEYKRAAIQWS